jgi:predicted TIM-barrel fold metal-dependent hydrolase
MIDAHIHAFPPQLSLDSWSWARERNELHWAATVAPTGRNSLQGWANAGDCLRAMDAAGIEKSILLGWYWQQAVTCDWHNALMAQWQQGHPDRFLWFAAMPMATSTKTLLSSLQLARDLGASGIGELHSGVQGFNYQDDNWRCLSEYCGHQQWPVNLHVTDPHSGEHPGRVETPLAAILGMLIQQPGLKVILAHLGGGLAWDETLTLPENCLLDTAAMPWLYPLEYLQRAIDNGYTQQLCFGSDFPLRLYPRCTASESLARFAEAVRQALPASAIEAATSQNILRFIKDKSDR